MSRRYPRLSVVCLLCAASVCIIWERNSNLSKSFVHYYFICSLLFLAHLPGGVASPKEFSVWVPGSAITRAQASAECRKWGGELASVTSQVENDKVQALAMAIDDGEYQCGNHVWMGLQSSKTSVGRTEGTWYWQDGTPVTFQNWGRTQQDGGDEPPYCGGMHPWGQDGSAPGKWFDQSCAHSAKWCYACQTRQIGVVFTPRPTFAFVSARVTHACGSHRHKPRMYILIYRNV